MKKLFTVFVIFSLYFQSKAQFWSETFGTGCSSGQLATAAAFTPTNGSWTVANIAAAPGNGAQANEWFVSATENGNAIGACGTGCGTNRTLHIGSNLAPLLVDPGAAFFISGTSNTNKRAESPTINCTGQSGINLSFKYLGNGAAGQHFCEVLYSSNNGAIWNVLGVLAPSTTGCLPQGTWAASTFALPAVCNNNPTVKIGFRWQNTTLAGADPSIALDDIQLSAAAQLTVTTTATACTNQTVTATLTGTTAGTTAFTWSTVPGTAVISNTTALGTTATINYNAPGTYSVIVVGFVGVVPTYTAVQNVTVNPTPTVTIANQTICAGGTATLDAGNPGATYQWVTISPAPGLLGTVQQQTVAPAVNSVYGVSLTLGGCTFTTQTNVNIGAGITVLAGANPTLVCPGAAVTLTASGGATYTWVTAPSNTVGTGSSIVVNPTVNTTYTVFGASGSCTGSAVVSVSTGGSLTIGVAAGAASVCPGQTVALTANGATNYTWTPSGSLSAPSGANVVASPTIPTTYTVIGNSGGCTGSATINVGVGAAPPVAVAVSATAVCTGFTSTLTATGAPSFTWTGSTFTNSILQPSVSVGPGTYTVIGSNGVGCNSFNSVTINTLAPLTINVSQSNPTVCIVSNFPFFSSPDTLKASGASTYAWFPPFNISNSISPNPIVRPTTSTCYTVIGNSAVCSGSAVICVTVIPQFTIGVTPPQPVMCLGDTLGLCVSSVGTLALGPPSGFTYNWMEAANAPPPSMPNNLLKCVTIYPQNTTTYTVEVRDNHQVDFPSVGCVSFPRLVTVTVLPQPLTAIAIPTINGVATNTVCFVGNTFSDPNVNIVLSAINNNVIPALPPGVVPTFTWTAPYANGTGFSPILSPNPGIGGGSPPTHTIIASAPRRLPRIQTYTVQSGYNGIPGCKRIDTISVIAVDCRSLTAVSFSVANANDTLCAGQDCITFLNFTDTLAGGPQSYTWTFAGGTPSTSTAQFPTICYNLPPPPGQAGYNVVLKVCNPWPVGVGSCYTKGVANLIKVVDIPNTTIVPPGQLKSMDYLKFASTKTYTASGAKWYDWRALNYYIPPPATGNSFTVKNPLTSLLLIVKGYNSTRCFSEDSVQIEVSPDCGEMFVPNAFSPNNDGVNDVLYVKGRCLQTLTFMVFNRWGEKVFETTDREIGWDGTYKGQLMNTDVFVYRLEGKTYDGKGYSLKGNITLVR